MAIRKKATRRTKAKRKKTLLTKTATPTKTETVRNNKRAMNGSRPAWRFRGLLAYLLGRRLGRSGRTTRHAGSMVDSLFQQLN